MAAEPVRRDALSFAGGARPAPAADRQCLERGWHGDGDAARKRAGAWRAVPPREHRVRAGQGAAFGFPRHLPRGGLTNSFSFHTRSPFVPTSGTWRGRDADRETA